MLSLKNALFIIMVFFFLSSASAYEERAAFSSQNGVQYVSQKPLELGVYSITGIPACKGQESTEVYVGNNDGKILISSTCSMRSLSIDFLIPKNYWVYQQQGTKWDLVQQEAVAQTPDGAYNRIRAEPETLGIFTFGQEIKADQVQHTIEQLRNASVSGIKAGIKQSAKEIRQKVERIDENKIQEIIAKIKERIERTVQKIQEKLKFR